MHKYEGTLSPDYKRLKLYGDGDQTLTVWQSNNETSPLWDSYVERSLNGQFQQTSMWARLKKLDGWNVIRIVITDKESMVGGFQILFRPRSYIGNIGLLIKGPVFESGRPDLEHFVIDMVKYAAINYKIKVIVVQPPDNCSELPQRLRQNGFLPNYIDYIIKEATVVIDLKRETEEILKSMKHAKRTNIRRAQKKGVTVREGHEEELGIFFEHMQASCKRQGVSPNPSNIEFLQRMWQLFYPSGHLKLFVAELEHEVVSAIIAIPFGRSFKLWKFGWSGKYGDCRPNDILYWEIFKWAKDHGFHNVDLVVISEQSAVAILRDGKRSEEITKTWSFFKLDFGGDIVLLPGGCIYMRNPIIRFLYKTGMPIVNRFPKLRKGLLQVLS